MADQFVEPLTVPYVKLDVKDAFDALSEKEKLYTYHLSKASWYGGLICLFQSSYESPVIFCLLQKLFSAGVPKFLESASSSKDSDIQACLTYAAAFYSNMGNYRSFGDSKIIPGLDPTAFEQILKAQDNADALLNLYKDVKDAMWSLDYKHLGFRPTGHTGYYSSGVTKANAEQVQRYLEHKRLEDWNTRVKKVGESQFEIWRAAAVIDTSTDFESFEDSEFRIVAGDYSTILKSVVSSLESASNFTANSIQDAMLSAYVLSFSSGSIDSHKDASRHWVTDKGPAVESYIGFIETYRDPLGVKAEWEGFVAVVNREQSIKFNKLVTGSEALLKKLPWPSAFEKDAFLRPDFTSLDVIAFASSGVPAGINIPNYDGIRQDVGFKNVSLGNVLAATFKQDSISFLSPENEAMFKKYAASAFQVQVGLHELLGHGSGKLFEVDSNNTYNFDAKNVVNPITSKAVSSWYKPGETWDSKFPIFGSSYEECRAECVGIYLCTEPSALEIFGHDSCEEADDIVYINWLMMARAGLLGLEFYRPENKSWGQAHMQARFAILQVMLEIGEGFVTIEKRDVGGLEVKLDRSKILSHGKPAIADFLTKLQVYKSTADFESGKALYDKYTSVTEEFVAFRKLVLEYKKPRNIIVQPHLCQNKEGDVEVTEFEMSAAGMITSFQKRFGQESEECLLNLWKSHNALFIHDNAVVATAKEL